MAKRIENLGEFFAASSRSDANSRQVDRHVAATLVAGDPDDQISIPVSLSMSRPSADRLRAFLAHGQNRFVVSSSDGALSVRISMVIARSTSTMEVVSHLGDAAIDWDRGTIERNERRATLSRTELRLLACLLEHAGTPVAHHELIANAWAAPPDDAGYNALAVYICYLRRNLKSIGLGQALRTVRGVGYSLATDAIPDETIPPARAAGTRGRPRHKARHANGTSSLLG